MLFRASFTATHRSLTSFEVTGLCGNIRIQTTPPFNMVTSAARHLQFVQSQPTRQSLPSNQNRQKSMLILFVAKFSRFLPRPLSPFSMFSFRHQHNFCILKNFAGINPNLHANRTKKCVYAISWAYSIFARMVDNGKLPKANFSVLAISTPFNPARQPDLHSFCAGLYYFCHDLFCRLSKKAHASIANTTSNANNLRINLDLPLL